MVPPPPRFKPVREPHLREPSDQHSAVQSLKPNRLGGVEWMRPQIT
jgi:hypothetical protein